MLIKIDVDSDLHTQIEELIKNGKYQDVHQFIKIAITNQIQEEKSNISQTQEKPIKPILHDVDQNHKIVLDTIRRMLSDTPLEKTQIPPPTENLIWSFYNRFFPVKIVIRQLAIMISAQKTWIELNKFQEVAYSFAEKFASKLKEYEIENNLPRNLKISTGLPIPLSELKTARGFQKRTVESKILASKLRFIEQFIGKLTSKDPPYTFKGACFEMNLMGVKVADNICYVTITDNGHKFALMENPIIDEERFDVSFSDDEVEFLMNKVIPRFKLEIIIVNKILDDLKKRDLTAEDIDLIFKEEKTHYENPKSEKDKLKLENTITSERVATMGRLSELRKVIWKIDSQGKSVYSLPNKQ